MRESKDLHKLELHDLFADLKDEFELQTREGDTSVPQITNALSAINLINQLVLRYQLRKLAMMRCHYCSQIWKIHA